MPPNTVQHKLHLLFFPGDNAYVLPLYSHCGQTLSCCPWIGWQFFRHAKLGRILQTANTTLR